ncbi:probable caskin-1 at C-terminar half [Coccomyxa sp. Obi]|nr:probable caskin-1 at C-terminar half [Coccomyxa sp. Obi]
MLPHNYTDAAAALEIEVNVGPDGRRFLLCKAFFEYETTALRALQRCGLLTAIIEVLVVDKSPADTAGSTHAVTSNTSHGTRIYDLRTGSMGVKRSGLRSIAVAQQPGNAVHGKAATCSCMLLLDSVSITGRLVAERDKQQLGQAAATSGATKSPTCMRPEAAYVTASLARIGKGSVVLDPCAGSCSLLHAARAASASCTLACDITAAFFPPASVSERQRVECAMADMRSSPIRRGTVDAIVTDPPYGQRASFGTCEQNGSTDEQFQDVVQALFYLAGAALREGGILVTWLPFTLGWLGSSAPEGRTVKVALQDWLQARGRCHGLLLRSLIAEERPGTACRAVAVFWKGDAPEACATSRHCTAGEATVARDLERSPSKEGEDTVWASSMRDRGYGASRTAKTGLDADIWRAAWMGDTEAISAYLSAGGCPDAPDGQGRTPLIFAAGYGRTSAAQLLLSAGACTAASANGTTPLHRAAARGHVAIMELLLQNHADVAAQDADGCTPLHLACRFGHAAAARALIRAAKARGCRPKVVDMLDGVGLAPLHSAAQWGHAEVARILLEEGRAQACVLSSPEALTPAHLAARWGHVHILELLSSHLQVDCGLQPDQATQPGKAGQQCGNDQGAFKALLELRSSAGNTVLDEARIWGRQRCCDYLDKL